MIVELSEELLHQLTTWLAIHTGLHYPRKRWPDLERAMRSAARTLRHDDAESCVRWLLSTPATQHCVKAIANHLTVGETYFFRHQQSLNILQHEILPPMLSQRRTSSSDLQRQLRVWSAGCCTGEELYSLTILLQNLLPDWQEWDLTLLGTDINPDFLNKAGAGTYSKWSFRNVSKTYKERYFTRTSQGELQIAPRIQTAVAFSYLNLATDSYPSPANNTHNMDLILCCNVLLYFIPTAIEKVVDKFYRSLREGGWLVVSPSEAAIANFSQFTPVYFDGIIFYQKQSHHAPRYQSTESQPYQDKLANSAIASSPSTPDIDIDIDIANSRATPPYSPEPQETPRPSTLVTGVPSLTFRSHPKEAHDLYQAGHYVAARERALAILERQPIQLAGRDRLLLLLARIYADQGELSQALVWCEQAVAANKLNPSSYYLLAAIQEGMGEVEAAMRTLKSCLYLNPRFVLAHFTLGNLARRQQKQSEAERHFRNTRRLLESYAPEDPLLESDGLTAGRLEQILCTTAPDEDAP